MSKEITAIDYDSLLKVFISKDELRPQMMQANTVGDKTYATDGHSRQTYQAHPKTPKYQAVIDQINPCEPITFKDTDLFKALQVHPKVYDTAPCDKCDGEGECNHCGAKCEECDGDGWVEDRRLPMVYSDEATIQIGDKYYTPLQLGKLEKVIIELMEETFQIIGFSGAAALFKVGAIEIIIARMDVEGREEKYPNCELKPITP
jgi:hypothetical protein